MSDAFSAFAIIGAVVLVAGAVLAAAMIRAAWAHREREALTSSDLRAVEESAMLLIEQLKTEADRVLADLDERRSELTRLIGEADRKIETLGSLAPGDEASLSQAVACSANLLAQVEASNAPFDTAHILHLASKGMDPVEIARTTGLDCADVKVALKIGQLRD